MNFIKGLSCYYPKVRKRTYLFQRPCYLGSGSILKVTILKLRYTFTARTDLYLVLKFSKLYRNVCKKPKRFPFSYIMFLINLTLISTTRALSRRDSNFWLILLLTNSKKFDRRSYRLLVEKRSLPALKTIHNNTRE